MKLLLDTHILLWALTDSPQLPGQARTLIEDRSNPIYYSSAALWEIELKHQSHPDRMLCSAGQVSTFCKQAGFQCLEIAGRHVLTLASLMYDPTKPPHHDPFDRIMVCQAKADGLSFVTHDSLIPGYHEPCVLHV